ncbi:glycoside hydrolase family 61 protein [Ceratobasidium sp. AG-Ba]|nr:glycoside hydrolase family 61 protein [Ceratobasidium sp. AG-Ba]
MAGLKKGNTYSFNLPNNLPAGDYIVRHELIALHFAWNQKDGAQFYPTCMQIRVGGGSKSPQAVAGAQTVSFPGGYTPNDKSLYVPDIFKNNFVYTFPGPKIYKSNSARDEIPASNSTITEESKRAAIVPEEHRRMIKARRGE